MCISKPHRKKTSLTTVWNTFHYRMLPLGWGWWSTISINHRDGGFQSGVWNVWGMSQNGGIISDTLFPIEVNIPSCASINPTGIMKHRRKCTNWVHIRRLHRWNWRWCWRLNGREMNWWKLGPLLQLLDGWNCGTLLERWKLVRSWVVCVRRHIIWWKI